MNPPDAFEMRTLNIGPPRRWRKEQQALRNARRPGLKPHRRKYWLGVARRWGIQFVCFQKRGVTIGNPAAIAKVRIDA